MKSCRLLNSSRASILILLLASGTLSCRSKAFNPGDPASDEGLQWLLLDCFLHSCRRACTFPDHSRSGGWFDMRDNVFLLHMDEIGATTRDSSASGLVGGYNGALSGQSGLYGSAIGFDGVDDGISFGTPSTVHSFAQGTASFWFRLTTDANGSLPQGMDLFRRNLPGANVGDMALRLASNAYLDTEVVDSALTTFTNRSDSNSWKGGVWYHAVLTWSHTEGRVRLYIDGVEQAPTTPGFSGTAMNPSAPILVGNDQSTLKFIGSLDELAVFSRALSAAEISRIYALQSTQASVCFR